MGLAQTETSTVVPVQIASIRPSQKTETEVKVSSGSSELYNISSHLNMCVF
jgi:hypothetical protein